MDSRAPGCPVYQRWPCGSACPERSRRDILVRIVRFYGDNRTSRPLLLLAYRQKPLVQTFDGPKQVREPLRFYTHLQ
jgi:hypothetical protein